MSGKPPSGKAGLVRQLLIGRLANGIELRMVPDSHAAGYIIKHDVQPERLIVGFTSSEAQMRAANFVSFGEELPRGNYRVTVIDPGHGGSDEGVKGANGSIEKNINLDIAKDVASIIAKTGALDVILTREDDSDQSPQARATKANISGGDIFVSIHCDGYASPKASGYCLEVYKTPDGTGFSSSEQPVGAVEMASWKNATERYARLSFSLSRAISDKLGGGTDLKEMGLRRTPAIALEGVDMPSVVVTCGFLTNSDDEGLLLNSASRHRIASAIAEGITQFVKEGSR